MVNKKFIGILLTLFAFFLVSCNTQKSVKNNFEEDIPDIISTNLDNYLHPDYSKFNGFNMTTDNISFKVDGTPLILALPIYLDKNRYYISLNEFTDKLDGKIEKVDNLLNININNENYSINLSNNIVNCPNNSFTLKKSLLNENDIYYIGFSDFSHMLNLYTRWDKDNKIINCKTNGFNDLNITPYQSKIDQIGFIRFEDVGLRSQPYCKDYFEKLRIIANYMKQKKIPYHIAWIPRYIIPNAGIDNDPLTKNNFEIAEMVYSLDFFSINNGIIGLHGYTHQLGNSESSVGFEFGIYDPSSTTFRKKIETAIETASFLDIPINFFEVPHYSITPKQNKIAEEYFKILYYPFNDYGPLKADLTKPQLSPYNKSSYYISTPLDYIPTGKEDVTLAKFKTTNIKNMGSVFFHPSLEDNYILLTEDSNRAPTFSYKDDSTLKKLVDVLEYKGYKMIKVTDI
jgi:hypothetical protein